MDIDYDLVFTMTNYYDGPRGGIANYYGKPHVYQSLFDEGEDEYSRDIYLLKPVDDETFELALEAWEIWLRWQKAYLDSVHGLERRPYPALRKDRKRRDELLNILAPRLKVDPETAIWVKAEFIYEEPPMRNRIRKPQKVKWTPIEYGNKKL